MLWMKYWIPLLGVWVGGGPYTLYDNLDDAVTLNNLIISSACKEHPLGKNETIHTKDKPWMFNEFRFFGIAILNVIKELYRLEMLIYTSPA